MMMKISVMGRSLMTLTLALAAGTLGGCGRSEPAREDLEINETLEAPIEAENTPVIIPPPVDDPANVAEMPPAPLAEADPGEEAQMREDADATGLTARMNPSEEAPVAAGNDSGAEQ